MDAEWEVQVGKAVLEVLAVLHRKDLRVAPAALPQAGPTVAKAAQEVPVVRLPWADPAAPHPEMPSSARKWRPRQ